LRSLAFIKGVIGFNFLQRVGALQIYALVAILIVEDPPIWALLTVDNANVAPCSDWDTLVVGFKGAILIGKWNTSLVENGDAF
jgi:hypothetical protein